MTKLIYATLVLSIFPFILNAQSFEDYLKDNAIDVGLEFDLNDQAYESLAEFKLIMVGEMHGTNEPALLVESLAELVLTHEKTVSIGLEIPYDQMTSFLEDQSEESLRKTEFFTRENIDGRNGQAWFDLILYCSTNPNIHLFFFDNYVEMDVEPRDSAMYLSVVKHHKQFPGEKIITLSGAIHGHMIPRNGMETLGSYCVRDTLHFGKDVICSIVHMFAEGTMMNNVGNGLELREVEFEANVFNSTVAFPNYLLFFETAEPDENNGIFYTRKVHHSELIK